MYYNNSMPYYTNNMYGSFRQAGPRPIGRPGFGPRPGFGGGAGFALPFALGFLTAPLLTGPRPIYQPYPYPYQPYPYPYQPYPYYR